MSADFWGGDAGVTFGVGQMQRVPLLTSYVDIVRQIDAGVRAVRGGAGGEAAMRGPVWSHRNQWFDDPAATPFPFCAAALDIRGFFH